jgi:hypothetical protein
MARGIMPPSPVAGDAEFLQTLSGVCIPRLSEAFFGYITPTEYLVFGDALIGADTDDHYF